MGVLTIQEIENKIRNCLDTLTGKECTVMKSVLSSLEMFISKYMML